VRIPRERWPTIGLALLIFGVFFVVGRLLGSIDVEKALHDVSHSLGNWTYGLVGLSAFLETGAFVGLVLPGETIVILGGAVAGQGATSIVVTIAVVWVCAWGGDTVSFFLGRRLGRGFIIDHGPKVRLTEERFRKVESYFDRYGGRTILIGRFIGIVRAIAPFSAGSSGMRYRAFLPYSVLGTGLWASAFCLVGYFASQSIDQAAKIAGRSTFYLGVAAAVVALAVVLVRYLRERENRKRLEAKFESTPFLRPLLRLRGPGRFVWERLTPGNLGLEFTALVAVAAVGVFALIAYGVSVGAGPMGGDRAAFDVAADLSTGWLTSVMKVITALGSAPVLIPVTVVAAVALARARQWGAVAALVGATILTFVAVDLIKDAVGRPRPLGALVATQGLSYPSGHSAHAVLYPWIAIASARVFEPARFVRIAAVAAGFALAVVIGLSRVYLHAHYLSDVAGGWGLGAAVFAGASAIWVAVAHFRQNPAGDVAAREHSD
jgi:membrane protein DedA with SNARE-associated domain/membrane-associated phospholipid phosphatase